MSAKTSCETYRPYALDAAIRDLTFDVYWPERLAELLAIKRQRQRENREAEEPTQYQPPTHRGCPP